MTSVLQVAARGTTRQLISAISSGQSFDVETPAGCSPLQAAIAARNVANGAILIERRIGILHRDRDGSNALHYACEHGLGETALLLVKAEPSLTHMADKHGNQPLWTAVFNARGELAIVRMLVEHGAQIDHVNNAGRSPLTLALAKEQVAMDELKASWSADAGLPGATPSPTNED